jgi:hypothetical protein
MKLKIGSFFQYNSNKLTSTNLGTRADATFIGDHLPLLGLLALAETGLDVPRLLSIID